MVHPELILTVEGDQAGLVFRGGRKKRITIGRTRGNSFQIKESTVSQKHALIEWKGEHWVLQDLGSSNGTFLNDESLDEHGPVNLRDGDVVMFGPDIAVKVQVAQELADRGLPNVKGKPKVQAENEPEVRMDEVPEPESKVQEGKVDEMTMEDVVEPRFKTVGNWLESEKARLTDMLYRGMHATIEDMVTYAKELQVELVDYATLDIDDVSRHMAC